MNDFLSQNSEALIWSVSVLVIAGLLLGLNKLAFWWLEKRYVTEAKHGAMHHTLALLRRIVNIFIYLSAMLLISYVFFDEEMYDLVTNNLKRVSWFFLITILTIISVAVTQVTIDRFIENSEHKGESDATTYRFLKYAITTSIYIAGALLIALSIPGLRTLAQSALAGAGLLAVIAGIASQEALANLVGGILVVVFRPFKIDDTVKIGDQLLGVVEDITLRHTVIRDFKNMRIVVPNAVINKEIVVNYDMVEAITCQWVEVGIAYSADLQLAKSLMRARCVAHPTSIDARTAAQRAAGANAVEVRVTALGDSSVTLRAWVWSTSYANSFAMRCDLYEQIKEDFDANGVEIPFPHRTLFLHRGDQSPRAEDLEQRDLDALTG